MPVIRITCRNNSDARRGLDLPAGNSKHNGGKVIIATVHEDDLADVTAWLDASHAVASEVRA